MIRRPVRAFLSVTSSLVLLTAVPVEAQTLNAGTYEGWDWNEVASSEGAFYIAEQCHSELSFTVDGAGNWSSSGNNEICNGRTTGPNGNSLFFGTPESFSDTGTRPLINAGGLLFEVYGEDDDEPEEGELRYGTLHVNPDQTFGMFTTYDKFEPGPEIERALVYFIDGLSGTPTAADMNGTYQFAYHAKEDDTPDQLFVEQGQATITFDGQGGCTFSVPSVTGQTGNLDFHEIDYRALSASGDIGNREARYNLIGETASNCSYSFNQSNFLEVSFDASVGGGPVESDMVAMQPSSDFQYLIAATGGTPSDDESGLFLGFKQGSGKNAASLDGTFLFATVAHGFDGSGTGSPSGQTDGQELFFFHRGALTFDSSTAAPGPGGAQGWSACSYEMRSHDWEHTMNGNPAGSSVVNNLVEEQLGLTAVQCAYQVQSDGGFFLFLETPEDEETLELTYRGFFDSNDDVLFLQTEDLEAFGGAGLYDVADLHFVSAIRYTGNLTGDADGDGIDNLSEFQFPNFSVQEYTKLLPLPDVNQNGSPDFAMVEQDTETGGYTIYIKDTTTTNTIQTITVDASQAIDADVSPDVSGNGIPEVAVLSVDSADDSVRVRSYDAATGNAVRNTTYAPAFRPMAMAVVPDIDGGSTPAIGVLGVSDAGDVRVQVKRVVNGALESNVTFAPTFAPKFLDVVPDVTGNNVSELAVLGINATGTVRVQLKDSATGTLKHWIQYAKSFTPVAMAVVPDADGAQAPAVSVLAINPVDGRVRVQTKFAETRTPVGTGFINFAPSFAFNNFTVVPDLNGNNVSELAYLGVDGTGTVRTQIKDTATRTLLRQVFFAKTFPPKDFAAMQDANGNSVPEVAVVGTNANNGNTRVQVKDSLSATDVSLIFVP